MTKSCLVCGKPLVTNNPRQKYHPGECRRLGYNAVANERVNPTPKSIAGKDLSDYTLLAELAESCGVSVGAVLGWLKRREKRRQPFYFVLWKRGYVRSDIAAEYAEVRTKRRTQGFVSVKSVLAELPYETTSGYHLLKQLERKGEITTQRARGNSYISREDADHLLRTFRSTLSLPGWVPLQETAAKARVTPAAVSAWAKRNGVELRFYRHPEHLHLAHYLEAKHAERYINRNEPRRKPKSVQLLEAA